MEGTASTPAAASKQQSLVVTPRGAESERGGSWNPLAFSRGGGGGIAKQSTHNLQAPMEEAVDVEEAIEALKKLVNDASVQSQSDIQDAVAALRTELRASVVQEVANLNTMIDKNAQSAGRAQASVDEVGSSLQELQQAYTATVVQIEEFRQSTAANTLDLEQRMTAQVTQKCAEGSATARKALTDARTAFDKSSSEHTDKVVAFAAQALVVEIKKTKENLIIKIDESDKKLEEDIRALDVKVLEERLALGQTIDAKIASVVSDQEVALRQLSETVRENSARLDRDARKAAQQSNDELEAALSKQLAAHAANTERIDADVRSNLERLARLEGDHSQATTDSQIAHGEAEQRLARVQGENCLRLVALEAGRTELEATCGRLIGTSTRRVEWRIEQCLERLVIVKDGHQQACVNSCFSADFNACGASGLRLELRTGESRDPSLRDTGDSSLYLWGPAGLNVVFRLYIGCDSVELQHRFDGQNPCGAKNLCFLSEQVNRTDDSLLVGVEVHEVTRELVGQFGTVVEQVKDQTAEGKIRQEEGSVVSHQYLNYRLLDLIQGQQKCLLELVQRKMDLVRSRAVRRVQWRLEHASKLRQCFPEGRSVCSTAFQAAGLSAIQLVFYPSGCAGAREGFCSFFISCPAGCTMRCWLWAGRWRREARLEPVEKTDLLGRINFCRFENCVDPVDESVELALEIEEAQQVERPLQSLEGTDSSSLPAPPLQRVDVSSVKVQQGGASALDVTGGPSQEHVKQLPSIWTTQGFRTFADVRADADRYSGQARSGATRGPDIVLPMSPRPATSDTRPSTRSQTQASKASPRKAPATVLPLPFQSGHKYQEYNSCKKLTDAFSA